MRRQPTYAEQRVWKALRKLNLNGSPFRRQVPLGPYVADFAHHGAKLIVELDGGVHRLPSVALRDAERDAWLTAAGWRILRFANDEAADPHALTARISEHLHGAH